MQPRASWLAAAAATSLHLACAAPSRVRSLPVSPAPTSVLALDVTSDEGAEIVALHSRSLTVYAFADFDASPRSEEIALPAQPRDAVSWGSSAALVAYRDRLVVSSVTRASGSWDIEPRPELGQDSIDALFTGDLDGDGRSDVGVVARTPDTLRLIPTRASPTSLPLTPNPQAGVTATAVDIDVDGDDDVVCVMPTGPRDAAVPDHLRVFRSEPHGLVDEAWYRVPSPRGVRAGDVDGDGRPDLLAYGPSGVWLLTNLGRGWFSQARALSRRETAGVVVADLDGDGRTDIAALETKRGRLRVWRGTGAGRFLSGTTVKVPPSAAVLEALPRPDGGVWLVTANPADSSITVVDLSGRAGERGRTGSRRTTTAG